MRFSFFLLFFMPMAAAAQGLQLVNPVGEYNQVQLTSYPVSLIKAPGIRMDAFLSVSGDSLFLTLTGSGLGTGTVDIGNETILTLENNNIVSVRSVAVQGFNRNEFNNTYRHTYLLLPDDLEILSKHHLQRIKKYLMDESFEIQVDEKNAESLKAASALLFGELEKKQLLKRRMNATAPAFPGGRNIFLQFLNRNLRLQPLLHSGETLTALIQFKVGADGSISDIKIMQSAIPAYADELRRVLSRMPRWKPALMTANGVDFLVSQELTFYRQDSVIRVKF